MPTSLYEKQKQLTKAIFFVLPCVPKTLPWSNRKIPLIKSIVFFKPQLEISQPQHKNTDRKSRAFSHCLAPFPVPVFRQEDVWGGEGKSFSALTFHLLSDHIVTIISSQQYY
jgi:hypothetical protein